MPDRPEGMEWPPPPEQNEPKVGSESSDRLGATIICCGKSTDDPCPTADGKCKCGGVLELEYGICCYGLGVFDRCQECCEVYNFHEDQG